VRRVQNDQLYAAFGRVRHTPDAAGPARARLPEEGRYVRRGRDGFGVGRTTAWRYVNKTVDLLAARAPKLRAAVRDAKKAGCAARMGPPQDDSDINCRVLIKSCRSQGY
jgi:hypothetical protein